MINTLIFDFGDVFINLDKKGAEKNALQLFDLEKFEDDMIETNLNYETGLISTTDFLSFYKTKFPALSENQIVEAWNFILKDFPAYRLQFIKELSASKRFKLILLSNTNDMHINYIKQNVSFFEEFKKYFDAFYLSHNIKLRKPNTNIFEFVIQQNDIKPVNSLFIDDTKENTDTASKLGFHIWNIDEAKEDVIDLFNIKKVLF